MFGRKKLSSLALVAAVAWIGVVPAIPQGATDHRFCADADGDGRVQIGDAITILNYLFAGQGVAPYCIAQERGLDHLASRDELVALRQELLSRIDAIVLEGGGLPGEQRTKLDQILNSVRVTQSTAPSPVRTIVFSGVNVKIENGTGSVDQLNGAGNLIIGSGGGAVDSGSHNLVVGVGNNYSSWGGIVAGSSNRIAGVNACAIGGFRNTASGDYSSTFGGGDNLAVVTGATVSGGLENQAGLEPEDGSPERGRYSTVFGGRLNTANGFYAAVMGGQENTASGHYSAVSGGLGNTAGDAEDPPLSSDDGIGTPEDRGGYASVSGGLRNRALGRFSAVSGGADNVAGGASDWSDGTRASISGGERNRASGSGSSVSGGSGHVASGLSSHASGGRNNVASGEYSSAFGGGGEESFGANGIIDDAPVEAFIGSGNGAVGQYSTTLGGFGNQAGEADSRSNVTKWEVVAGGRQNRATKRAAVVALDEYGSGAVRHGSFDEVVRIEAIAAERNEEIPLFHGAGVRDDPDDLFAPRSPGTAPGHGNDLLESESSAVRRDPSRHQAAPPSAAIAARASSRSSKRVRTVPMIW